MRTHTNEFKEELKVFGRQIQGKIVYYPSYELITEDSNNILTEADLQIISEQDNYNDPIEINSEDIFSISIIKNGDLLQSLMKEFDFESKIELNIGSVVNPQFGLLVNGDYEYLNYGNYVINSKEFNMDTDTWSYVCYDKMLFSMVKYRGLSNIEYPITIKQFINKLCNKVGLEFEDSEFVNQGQLIYEDLYKNRDVTYRDIFDEISKIVAGNLLINDNDKLEVGYPKRVGEGENVSGSDISIEAVEEPISDVKLEGDTQQEGTPTPNNPQNVEVVTGGQNVEIVGKNLLYSNLTYPFTINGVTVTKEEDGSITLNGTQSGGAMHIIFNNDFFDSIKNYVGREISISLTTNGEGSFSNFGIKNGTATDILVLWSPSLSKTQTLNLNNYTNIYFDIWFDNNSRTFVNYNIKPQVEVGNATTYEPYQSQNYPVNLGKNLFDKDNANILNGWMDNKTQMYLQTSQNNRILYISCQPNTTYTISRSILTNAFRVATYDSTPIPTTTSIGTNYVINGLIKNNNATSITITTGANAKYLLVHYGNIVNDTNINESLASIQIEKGSQATEYVPYFEPIELCKIGDYQDYIYKSNGNWYYSNLFTKIESYNGETITTPYISTTGGLDTGATIYYYNGLNTPIQITNTTLIQQLDNLKNATLYNGVNNISVEGNLPSILNLDYISEYESINEDYLKDTNVRMSERIGVINSVAILDTDNDLQYIAEDTQSIKENEMTRVTITDNLIAMNGETQEIADNILNKLNGLYYYANDLQTTGVCYYDFLDMFNVEARGNIYQCLLLNNEITITQGIEEHIFTENFEELETNANEYTTSVISNKQVQFKINQQEGRIESKVEKDGVISAINQSAEEIQINADKLSFEGATIDMTADNVKIKGENLSIDGDEISITDNGDTYDSNFKIEYEDNNSNYWIKNKIYSHQATFIGKDNYSSPGYLGKTTIGLSPGVSSFSPIISLEFSRTENDDYTKWIDEDEYLDYGLTSIGANRIYLYYNNKDTTITANGITTPTLTQTSKEETKKNFERLTNAKDILNQVDIYKYNFKEEKDTHKKSIGFVIGDKFNYSQEITSENNDGANIYSMVSVLWQVVKEQQEEINELKEMIKYGKY